MAKYAFDQWNSKSIHSELVFNYCFLELTSYETYQNNTYQWYFYEGKASLNKWPWNNFKLCIQFYMYLM